MIIRKMSLQDLESVAKIHKNAYPDDHFSAHFTLKMLEGYYAEFLNGTKYAYVAEEGRDITGFLIAGRDLNRAAGNFIKRNWPKLLLISMMRPGFIFSKISRFFSYERKEDGGMVLFSIAVSPLSQRTGAGRELIGEFEKDLIKDGITSYDLSVKPRNKKAIEFYMKSGYIIVRSDRNSIFFRKNIR